VRLTPRPRVVDWTLLGALAVTFATGIVSLVSGRPSSAWVFVLHGASALTLVVLLGWKLRRVYRRLRGRTVGVALSAVLVLLAVSTLGSGLAWVLGADVDLWGWTLLNLHIGLALVLVPVLLVHLLQRARRPTTRDWEGRRTVLQYAALAAFGGVAWRASQAAGDAVGDVRRFTGSKPEGGTGNRFPVTSWVLDDPDPIAVADWQLHVTGLVEEERTLTYADVDPADSEQAILDCTSGWYVDREWQGVRVDDLLSTAGGAEDARWVTFHSVTGYRFGFPLDEAREMLLATHVDGERLTHGHGFPLRVVAPGRRGFQWVKWVTAVEVRKRQDLGQWTAIFVSGLD
jgi:DMSO/TMAO reductase YedYZ molybdopterin-dependent catalytic subunit